jgi:nitrogen regulatory protein P-II 1
MKEIKAIIQPFKANQVLEALHRVQGISGVMAGEVRCTSLARGVLNPDVNVKIELYVPDELVEEVIRVIEENARTGRVGDGRIFVVEVQQTVLIRSGERDSCSENGD